MVLSLGHILNSLLQDAGEFKHIFSTLLLEFPSFLVKIFPVSCLIASLFSINKLTNRNELTAIFASGFSRRDFILTIGSIGAIVGVILFIINAYLVPFAKHKQDPGQQKITTSKGVSKRTLAINTVNAGKIWFKGQNYFVSYSSFDRSTNTLYNLSLYYFDQNHKLTEQISSAFADYRSGDLWNLNNGLRYTNLDNKTFPVVSTFKEISIPLKETLADFNQINSNIATMNIWKLYDYINVLRTNKINYSEYYVTFLDKFSSAFTCLVLAILASTALFNPNRRNSSFGKNVAFVLTFTFMYWFIYSYFMTLGQTSKIPAPVGTFGVPVFFSLYLAAYFIYHRKLR
jgi:lipopolysaccharide export system permease protein